MKLENFRLLITYIGNCLAFVRILRTASFNYLSKNIEFIPFIEKIDTSYGDICKVLDHKSHTLLESCTDLDDFIQMIQDKFSEKEEKKDESDFLRVININCEVISKRYIGKLQGDGFAKLKFFYMFIPALTLDYIQSLLVAKEQLLKKKFKGGYISDDGFIIGLAFLTQILNQSKDFEETLWFEEVKEKVNTEVKELEGKFKLLEEEKVEKTKKTKDEKEKPARDKYKDDVV